MPQEPPASFTSFSVSKTFGVWVGWMSLLMNARLVVPTGFRVSILSALSPASCPAIWGL